MNHSDKQRVVARANERRGAISDAKGPEYAGQADAYKADTSDVLANFKRQDARWGYDGSGLCSAFLYFGKHLDSIETFAREVKPLLAEGATAEARYLVEKGEGIISRLDDARNYIDLIEALLVDADLHPGILPDLQDFADESLDAPDEPSPLDGMTLAGWEAQRANAGPTYLQQPDSYPTNAPPEDDECDCSSCVCDRGDTAEAVEGRTSEGEALYLQRLRRVDSGQGVLVTSEERRELERNGLVAVAYRLPREGDVYLYPRPVNGGWVELTAWADHAPDEPGAGAYLIVKPATLPF